MPATIRSRIFCLPLCYPKNKVFSIQEYKLVCFFYESVELFFHIQEDIWA